MYNFHSKTFRISIIVGIICTFYKPVYGESVQLTQDNFDSILASTELVFIIFYVNWCWFSKKLIPIFDKVAAVVAKEFPEAGRVVIGKVDCDKETLIATRFHISKYPTLKVIRNGHLSKKEYRGQRSAEALTKFIQTQLEDPVKEFGKLSDLDQQESNKSIIIGYFDRRDQPEYQIYRRIATSLKDDCQFYVGFGEASQQIHPPGQPIIVFRPNKDQSTDLDETYTGSLTNFDELYVWARNKCVSLIREITFETVEELTAEGLPFLILFHAPDDTESVKQYHDIVKNELLPEKQSSNLINFLTADVKKFANPLGQLGKSEQDLPLIALESFRHMYLFPKFEDIEIPGKLKQFIQDLYSGKLHREFHYGPDSNNNTEKQDKPTKPPGYL